MVKAVNCEVVISTVRLIAICLSVIKERATNQLNASTSSREIINPERIRWVITVPAIWVRSQVYFGFMINIIQDIAARQAMENAAVAAGFPSEQIEIALEPEAAVLDCLQTNIVRKLILDILFTIFQDRRTMNKSFVVVDAGGGTIDIAVYKSCKSNDTLVEVIKPSGGDWGSYRVNQQFEELLAELLGAEYLKTVKGTHFWYEVLDAFEVRINNV